MSFLRNYVNSNKRHSEFTRQLRLVPCLELLEDRTVPSGSSFQVPIGTLPSGKNVTVRFDATLDSPATKGIDLIYNQGSVSGSNFATVKTDDPSQGGNTDPTRTNVNLAPMVTGVYFRSSTWNGTFLGNLQSQGAGNSSLGYAIPSGANQTANLPWYGMDRISIRFSEDVNVAADDLQLFGVTVPSYGLGGFTYSNAGGVFVATWSMTTPISNDQLRVVLDGSASGVTEVTGGNRLDGEWLDNTAAFPSGNGTGGGDFSMRANVLGGDTNQDGVVNTTDTILVRNAIGGNNVYRDVNGDGAVNTTDFVITRASIGQAPPVGTPGGTAGSGWVASNTPTLPNPPGGPANTISAAKTAVLLTDLNGNGLVDTGDTVRYTIVITNTGGTTATGVQLDDSLDSHTTLVNGSLDASPLAFDDVFSANDNADLVVSSPASGLFNNDVEFLGDTFTLQGFTQPGAVGATVTVNADGTFTYHPANPFSGPDTFTYTIVDSQGMTSTGTVTVNVTHVSANNAPVLANIEGAAVAYTENQVATNLTANLTVTDSDSLNLAGATISITSGFAGAQDVLAFTNQNGITGSYNTATGVLTLTGSSSVANYQTALRSITYFNTSDNPSGTTRTISFQVSDGTDPSNTVTRNITVTPVNDAPVLAAIDGGALAYTENQVATAVTAALTVNDVDSANLTGATVSITSGFAGVQDVLAFTNQNGITGSYNTATGVLTLSGSSSLANYQTSLRSITYFNSSDNPSGATRTISFQVDDGQAVNHASNTVTRNITVAPVNDNPVLAAIEGGALAYTENQVATAITASLTVNDADSANLAGATVSITANFAGAEDVLAFTNQNGITGSYNTGTGVLTLSGSSSVANYQTALRSITYFNNSNNPSGSTRTISFQVNDGAGVNNLSNTATRDITVAPVNDAPVLAAIEAGALAYTENQVATAITATLTVIDVDSTNLTGATVSITANFAGAQDVLAFTNQNGITGSYNTGTGVLTLSGTSSVANYQTALRSITYFNSSDNPSGSTRTITFQVDDGQAVNHASNTVTRNITVTPVNDAPVLAAIEGTSLAYNQNAAAVVITTAITVNDVDSANLTGATVSISAGYVNGQDTLTFTNQNGITGSFAPATGILTLSGSSSVANYQTALRSVGFTNSQGATNTASRTISFQVDDGQAVNHASNAVTRTITINRAPTGVADNYNAVGNTQLLVGVAQGGSPAAVTAGTTLSNDSDVEGNTPITIGTVNTAGTSGSVVMNSDGTFTFTPNAGFTGATTFTYTVVDSLGAISNPVTVTITVATKVWYIDSTAGTSGDGRSNNPFDSLADLTGASGPDAAGDIIYVREQSGDYNGNLTLLANQQLIGSGVNLVVGGFTLLAATSNTTWTTTVAATDAISLSTGNTIRGFTIGSTTGTHITGTAVGSLNIDTVTLNGSGAAFNISTSGALAVTIDSLTSTSSTTAVNLVGTTGSFVANAGAISGATGTDFNVSGGTSNITFAGTITNTAGNSVVVASHTGGTVAFSGAISDTGSGISLTSNTGATINFTGGLSISTGANTGFSATGGGTVTATQNNTTIVNTITTTSGNGLIVGNTTIGAAGLTFRSITAGTAAGTAGVGISLDTTGSSGGLTITGNGTAGSGGTIQHKTGADQSRTSGIGIYLNSTRNVSLTRMQLNDFDNFAIRGFNVNGFSLTNSVVNGSNGTVNTNITGDSYGEGSIYFGNNGGASPDTDGLSGTATISNTTISGGRSSNVVVVDTSSAAGELHLTINADTFGLTQTLPGTNRGNQSLLVEARGAGTITHAVVTSSTFAGQSGDNMNFTGQQSTTMHVIVGGAGVGNTLSNTHTQNDIGGNSMFFQSAGTMFFDVRNNTMSGANGSGVTFFKGASNDGSTPRMDGNFDSNTIGISGVTDSGSKTGNGIFISAGGTGSMTYAITNNIIQQYHGNGGIYADNTGGSYSVNMTVTGNTTRQPGAGAFAGFALTNGSPGSADTINVFARILNNDFSTGDPTNSNDIIIGASGSSAASHTFTLSGAVASDVVSFAAIQNFLKNNNNLNGASAATVATAYTDAPVTVSAFKASASLPPLPTVPTPMFAAPGGVQSSKPLPKAANLSQAQLSPIVAEAIRRWSSAGLTPAELAKLRSVSVQIADLPGQYLGTAPIFGKTITIDTNAAGYGWFIDSTPRDDAEFGVKGTGMKRFTTSTQAPAGRMDLLTVVMHEFSHILGMDSSYDSADSDSIVSAYLTAGTRILPGIRNVAQNTVSNVSRIQSSLIADLLFISKTNNRRSGTVYDSVA